MNSVNDLQTRHTLGHVLDQLFATIISRKSADPATSYTADLFSKGTLRIAQKVGEEGLETALAATTQDPKEIINESVDLLFHLLVLWADQEISTDAILDEIVHRQGLSGLDKKSKSTDPS